MLAERDQLGMRNEELGISTQIPPGRANSDWPAKAILVHFGFPIFHTPIQERDAKRATSSEVPFFPPPMRGALLRRRHRCHPSHCLDSPLSRRATPSGQTMRRVAPRSQLREALAGLLGERQSDNDGVVVGGAVAGRELGVDVNHLNLGTVHLRLAHQDMVKNLGVAQIDIAVAILER